MYKRKSWKEKLEINKEPEVVVCKKKYADIPAGASILIANPKIVSDYIKHIPKGKTTSLQQMRKDLAAEYNADYMCPITAGIFLRIAAEAAYEEYEKGKSLKSITPFWRMIDERSPAIKKLSFGKNFVLDMRRKERLAGVL